MKLLEYEAKELLRAYGMKTPDGRIVRTRADVLDGPWPAVVKAQIPVGGRGKAGGIIVVGDEAGFADARTHLLGRLLLGHAVKSLLVEVALQPVRELYLAVVLDRTLGQLVLLAHRHGGVDINEAVAADGAALQIPLRSRPKPAVTKQVLRYLELDETFAGELDQVIKGLWEVCVQEEAALVEVNPLMAMADGRLICADAKIELDDAAVFRHPDRQLDTQPASAQFVILEAHGTVASLANGAGLAMATNDAIKAAGGEPANFFDVGGGTNAADMTRGFDMIRALPDVRAVVVNIYGGITRCDEVAEAILAARAAGRTPPLYIRLAGTNAAEGAAMLEAAGLELRNSLGECVAAAVKEAGHV